MARVGRISRRSNHDLFSAVDQSAVRDARRGHVSLLGWLHVVLGTFMIGVDLNAGMPFYWVAGEGLPIALTGCAILWLFRRSSSGSE